MPHIIVKLRSEQPEQKKQRLADAIARDVMDVLQYGEECVSVEFEEAAPQDLKKRIHQTGVQEEWNGIYRKPGYEPF